MTLSFLFAGVLACQSNLGVSAIEPEIPGLAPRMVDCRPESASFALQVTLKKLRYARGESIVPRIQLRNTTDRVKTFVWSQFAATHQIILRDEQGKEPTLTDVGRLRLAIFEQKGVRDHAIRRKLDPGQIFEGDPSVDLRLGFVLEPGIYTLQVICDDEVGPPSLWISSNTVRFLVD